MTVRSVEKHQLYTRLYSFTASRVYHVLSRKTLRFYQLAPPKDFRLYLFDNSIDVSQFLSTYLIT